MMPSDVNWAPALIVLALGVTAGLYLWRLLRAAPRAQASAAAGPTVRALELRRDALIADLRTLDDASSQLTPAELAHERDWLELEAARVLRELDRQGAPRTAKRPPREPAAAPAGGGSTLRGFLWGAGSVAAIALLFYLATQSGEPRAQGTTAPEAPTGGVAAPDDPETVALRQRIEQHPEDIDARLDLARRALAANDMMSVFNETRFVLERQPDEPRALTYQAVVRLAMGQATRATQMLERAIALRPDLEDAHVYLMLVYTETGNPAAADKALARAVKQLPAEKQNLEGILARMRSEASAAGKPPLKDAPENPHAGLDAAGGSSRPPATAAPSVAGTVSLAPDAQAPKSPHAAIYLLLRRAGQHAGPPLAVKKLPAAAFPVAFEIGATDSMTGAALPQRVELEARLDDDGDAATRTSQESTASADDIALGTRDVRLTLTPRR